MDSKRTFSFPAVGGTSLLVIFAVLCLTFFSLLSLSTAQADFRLADASVQAVEGYYEADARAEEILALLRAGEHPEQVRMQDGICHYLCPISDTQALAVAVSLDGDSYTILRWQSVSTAPWTPDDDLPVWDGSP